MFQIVCRHPNDGLTDLREVALRKASDAIASHRANSGAPSAGLAAELRNISNTARTVSSRARNCISEDERPQILWQSLFVGPSKSQCDAPLRTTVRNKRGTARAMERPLPKRLQLEGSASSTTAGAVNREAA